MSHFDFKTFDIDEDDNLELHNVANFEIFLLATTAVGFLIRAEEDSKDKKDGEIPQFVNYTRWAKEKIEELAASEDIEKTAPEIKAVIEKNLKALDYAKEKLSTEVSKLKIGGFEEEFWWFYTEAMSSLVDQFKILKHTDEKSKECDGEYTHYTRVQFKHGTNTWAYNVRVKEQSIEIKSFMNGKSTEFDDNDDSVCQELVTVDLALKGIARSIAAEKGFLFMTEKALKDKQAVSKAKTIAIILGGNYEHYALSAKNFATSLNGLLSTTTMKKEYAAKHILNKQFRVSASQLDQIISVLMPQTTWH